MRDTILFIHGEFQNAKSWEPWSGTFTSRGHQCVAESWPLHDGDPSQLRASPPAELGNLRLQAVVDRYASIIRTRRLWPIAIGHSVGGLVVQKLMELNLVKAGIAISSVAPNRMLAFDWGFFRDSVETTNPLVNDKIFRMTPELFHKNFANTLGVSASNRAYDRYVTHDSRNVLRDCLLSPGRVDVTRPHVPLLFIDGEKDEIVPPKLCEQNVWAYEDPGSVVSDYVFPNRGHFICGEPGWEEVAEYAAEWITRTSPWFGRQLQQSA